MNIRKNEQGFDVTIHLTNMNLLGFNSTQHLPYNLTQLPVCSYRVRRDLQAKNSSEILDWRAITDTELSFPGLEWMQDLLMCSER